MTFWLNLQALILGKLSSHNAFSLRRQFIPCSFWKGDEAVRSSTERRNLKRPLHPSYLLTRELLPQKLRAGSRAPHEHGADNPTSRNETASARPESPVNGGGRQGITERPGTAPTSPAQAESRAAPLAEGPCGYRGRAPRAPFPLPPPKADGTRGRARTRRPPPGPAMAPPG